MKNNSLSTILMCCSAVACAGGGHRNSDWNIDYSSVYRAYEKREIDNSYRAPSVIGCVDDDLYNCQ